MTDNRPDAGCCEEDGAGDDDAGKQVVVHGQDVGAGPCVQEPDTNNILPKYNH